MADIYAKILVCSGSGGYKNLKFVANCMILRRLNKLIPVFILEKKQLVFGKNIFLKVFKDFFFKIHFYNFLIKITKCMPNLYILLHRHTLTGRYMDRHTDITHIHTHARHVHMNIDRLAASAIYHQTNAQSLLG